jgi:predicted DNA-binding transcriptional regulator YafY
MFSLVGWCREVGMFRCLEVGQLQKMEESQKMVESQKMEESLQKMEESQRRGQAVGGSRGLGQGSQTNWWMWEEEELKNSQLTRLSVPHCTQESHPD